MFIECKKMAICSGSKCNGQPCTFKCKKGSNFCGRHQRKDSPPSSTPSVDVRLNGLNDPTSQLWKDGLEITKNVDEKISKSGLAIFSCGIKLIGTKEEMHSHLKVGVCTNLVQTFFKTKISNCVICNSEKSKTNQLERAHCNLNKRDRPTILAEAIDMLFVDENTPISMRDIIKQFLSLHEGHPFFILCKTCHTNYDTSLRATRSESAV